MNKGIISITNNALRASLFGSELSISTHNYLQALTRQEKRVINSQNIERLNNIKENI